MSDIITDNLVGFIVSCLIIALIATLIFIEPQSRGKARINGEFFNYIEECISGTVYYNGVRGIAPKIVNGKFVNCEKEHK